MTTALNQPISQARTEELVRDANKRRLALSRPLQPLWSPLVLRLATAHDKRALERLAQLDSRPTPRGTTLIAELRGSPVAAVSLPTGELIADPFVRTGEITELLRLRASQLSDPDPGRGWFAPLRHSA
jgi:hypothetical protein